MHTIQIDIDESIFENVMGILEILPKDKLKVTSKKNYPDVSLEESKQTEKTSSMIEVTINAILEEQKLNHFKFFKDPDRILYTRESGTPTHVQDFHRLIRILKNKKINFNDIGVDVIMIEEETILPIIRVL